MASSKVLSYMLLLLLVLSLYTDEAFGAQTINRKLKETIKLRRNLEGDEHRSSKIGTSPSESTRCGGGKKTLKNMVTYGPHDQFSPLPKGDSSSLCIRCIITKTCQGIQGTPLTCTTSERCETIPGH